ncbi:MAG: amidase [Actinomycetota bacterium]|nr:amidase [Actinomycetota bacterium]
MDAIATAFSGAAQQVRLLASGAITAPELLELYLGRIARLDDQLNTFRTVRLAGARSEAVDAQRRLDAGERLPLLGVPVAIKDDVDVAGEHTAWGTALHGPPKVHDAEVVRRLRVAGAVVIGKTNVPELTIWPFTDSPTFGATRNPWDPSRSPGGSSGGTAAAVAAGLAPFGLGSDGGGSIRTPATWCGLYGMKPQRGRVPLAPHDDGWEGLIVNGPITRTVEDAALFLDVTTTLPAPEGGFVVAASRTPARLRIAISAKSPLGVVARVGKAQRNAVTEAGALLRALGHDVDERAPDYAAMSAGWNVTARYLRGIHDDVATLGHPELLERRTRSMARAGARISDRRIAAVRAAEAALALRVNAIFDDVNVLLTPGTAVGPPRVGASRRRGAFLTASATMGRSPFQAIFNATGQPAAVVPWGLDAAGLPTSVQLVGRPSDEATLLALSAQIESARPWAHRRPSIS